MKTLILLLVVFTSIYAHAGTEYVQGYYKADGTYVNGYYRTTDEPTYTEMNKVEPQKKYEQPSNCQNKQGYLCLD